MTSPYDAQHGLGRVDACIVTKRTWHEIGELTERSLAGIPCHYVTVERGRPSGLARGSECE